MNGFQIGRIATGAVIDDDSARAGLFQYLDGVRYFSDGCAACIDLHDPGVLCCFAQDVMIGDIAGAYLDTVHADILKQLKVFHIKGRGKEDDALFSASCRHRAPFLRRQLTSQQNFLQRFRTDSGLSGVLVHKIGVGEHDIGIGNETFGIANLKFDGVGTGGRGRIDQGQRRFKAVMGGTGLKDDAAGVLLSNDSCCKHQLTHENSPPKLMQRL